MATAAQSVGQQAVDAHPLDKFISALVELRDELIHNIKHMMDNSAQPAKSPVLSTPCNSNSTSNENNKELRQQGGEDPELQASLRMSMASYEEEERARLKLVQAEQAALDAATQASLLSSSFPAASILPAHC